MLNRIQQQNQMDLTKININNYIDNNFTDNLSLNLVKKIDCKSSQGNQSLMAGRRTRVVIPERRPCNHVGACNKMNCECIKKIGYCDKFCICYNIGDCQYPGCECLDTCTNGSNKCRCIIDGRECDPDICHKKNKECLKKYCENIQLFENKSKKTSLSRSNICDYFGLFAMENIKKDSFICEYKGEILYKQETERRYIFNDMLGLNYLFGLTNETDIDAFRAGNEMRYVNHSSFGYQNCYAKEKYVRGIYKIGLYALRNIDKGEELYFDYCMPDKINWLAKYNRYYSKKIK
jgi:histone-lysine N-methyltransferase EZH2